MKTLFHKGHKIEVKLYGTEKVFYDGKLMSSVLPLLRTATHIFQVDEDGENVSYEVEIIAGFFTFWMKIRRNGILIYSDK